MTNEKNDIMLPLSGATIFYIADKEMPKNYFNDISAKLRKHPNFEYLQHQMFCDFFNSKDIIQGNGQQYRKTLVVRELDNFAAPNVTERLNELGLTGKFGELELIFTNIAGNHSYIAQSELKNVNYTLKEAIEIAQFANAHNLDFLITSHHCINDGQLAMTNPVYEIVKAHGKLNPNVHLIE
jgi:hypothetical protein